MEHLKRAGIHYRKRYVAILGRARCFHIPNPFISNFRTHAYSFAKKCTHNKTVVVVERSVYLEGTGFKSRPTDRLL